jgi:hypothetical protein
MNETTKKTYQAWLAEQTWDYFFTGTFRKEYSVNGSRRAGERFFRGFPTLELGVLFIEGYEKYGRVHLHGLLRFNRKYTPPAIDIWNGWFKSYGRARVEEVESQQAVSKYCSKYITKTMKDETYILL